MDGSIRCKFRSIYQLEWKQYAWFDKLVIDAWSLCSFKISNTGLVYTSIDFPVFSKDTPRGIPKRAWVTRHPIFPLLSFYPWKMIEYAPKIHQSTHLLQQYLLWEPVWSCSRKLDQGMQRRCWWAVSKTRHDCYYHISDFSFIKSSAWCYLE